MNEDYLWDKSGQPDPQIQELEEILGTLGYQPKPFEVPSDVPLPRRRNYFPLLAIAATVLVALLAGGIWLRVRSGGEAPKQQAKLPSAIDDKATLPEVTKAPQENKPALRETIAVNKHRNRIPKPRLGKYELEEAIAAKEQLMLALRITSEKLNLVHRKTQTTTPASQIRNQHRIG